MNNEIQDMRVCVCVSACECACACTCMCVCVCVCVCVCAIIFQDFGKGWGGERGDMVDPKYCQK